jgi:Tfp pilus assembly protein PilO
MSVSFDMNKLQLDNQKLILIGIVFLGILYADYSFIMGMQRNSIKSMKPQIEKIKKDIATLHKNLAELDSLKTKQLNPEVKIKKLVLEEQLTALFEDISLAANTNSVKIMQIKPVKEYKSKDEKAFVASARLSPLYITLDLYGSYHNIGSFINDLENADKFISILEVKITRDSADKFKENVSLLLKTYAKK